MRHFPRSALCSTAYHIYLFLFTLAGGELVSQLLDHALSGSSIADTGIRLALLLTVGVPLTYCFRRALGGLLRRDRQRWREYLYTGILHRDISVASTGGLDVRLSNDADAVSEFCLEALPAAIENAGILLGSTTLLCITHLPLGLLLSGMALLQLVPAAVYTRWVKEIYEATSEAEIDYDGFLIQGADGITALKSFHRESWFLQKLDEITVGMVRAGIRAEQAGAVEEIVSQFIGDFLKYGSYVVVGLFVLFGQITLQDTPVLLVLSGYVFGAVPPILEAAEKRAEYKVAMEHLAVVSHRPVETPNGPVATLEHVHCGYGDKTVLQDVSLSIRPGEKVLLQGENGSGKSTLLKVLLGITEPDQGSVSLDRSRIAYALQEEPDLPETGLELQQDLLSVGNTDPEVFAEYLAAFQVTHDTLEKPLADWSMGQRKKFCLAAAFARDADLLLLDEPANHLDQDGIHTLQSLLQSYPGAILAVSHNTQPLTRWDRVYAVEGGRLR